MPPVSAALESAASGAKSGIEKTLATVTPVRTRAAMATTVALSLYLSVSHSSFAHLYTYTLKHTHPYRFMPHEWHSHSGLLHVNLKRYIWYL